MTFNNFYIFLYHENILGCKGAKQSLRDDTGEGKFTLTPVAARLPLSRRRGLRDEGYLQGSVTIPMGRQRK